MQFIPIKPMSVNEAWAGKRFKTPKYQKYEQDCFILLRHLILPEPPFELKLIFAVSNMGQDVDNPTKLFIDILQKKYKFNDKYIMKLSIEKEVVPKGREYIGFEILSYKKKIILT